MSGPIIEIHKIDSEALRIPIIGTSPLIMHRFSEKARKAMLDIFQGNSQPRENKDPEQEYKDSIYWIDDSRYGYPAAAFKACTVGAARYFPANVTMTMLKQAMFFRGEMGKSDGRQMFQIFGEPHMREDVVRNKKGTDLRYRAEFSEWSSILTVVYVKSLLSRDSVMTLIDAGGMSGAGEWRPSRNGDFGTYKVDPTREVDVLG